VPPEARYMGRDLDFCLDVFDYEPRDVAAVTARCRVEPELLGESAAHRETRCLAHARTRCFEVRRLIVSATFTWPAAAHGRLLVVANGRGRVRVGDRELDLLPGARFFLAAAAEAKFTPAAEPLELLVCQACG